METLLRAWGQGWRRTSSDWSASDLNGWEEALSAMQPIPPRNYLPGARRIAELRGLRWKDVLDSGACLVFGSRVSFRRFTGSLSGDLKGWGWEIFLDANRLPADFDGEEFAHRVAGEVESVAGGWILDFENHPIDAAVPALLQRLVRASSGEEYLRLWDIGRILDVCPQLLELLPSTTKAGIAAQIRQELAAHSEALAFEVDLELIAFGEERSAGNFSGRKLGYPPCRFTQLLETSENLRHLHRDLGEDYFSNRASDYCLLADTYKVASYLAEAPVGAALIEAFDAICYRRPRLLVDLCFHFSFTGVAAFALTRLRRELHHEGAQVTDLVEEWEQVQKLGRELLLRQDRGDHKSHLALGIRDLSLHLRDQDRPGRDQDYVWHPDLWKLASARDLVADKIVHELSIFLGTPECGEEGVLFALHWMSWDQRAAKVLTEPIVTGYGQLLRPRVGYRPAVHFLPAFGDLLARLWDEVSVSEVANQWLNPVDWQDLASKAASEVGDEVAPDRPDYRFQAPRIATEHLSVLAAQGCEADSPGPIAEAVTDQVVQILRATWVVAPFDWSNLSDRFRDRAKGTLPLFQGLGRLFSRVTDSEAMVRAILERGLPVKALADLKAGLGEGHSNELVKEALRGALVAFLSDDSAIALGEALDASASLLDAGDARSAERCAQRALRLLDEFLPDRASHFRGEAQTYLALALGRQGSWAELVELDLREAGQSREVLTHNLRAAAFLELNQLDEAQAALFEVLRRKPGDATARLNSCYLEIQRGHLVAARKQIDELERALGHEYANELSKLRERLDAPLETELADFEPAGITGAVEPVADQPAGPQAQHLLTDPKKVVPPEEHVDLAILTIISEEYQAVLQAFPGLEWVRGSESFPNVFSWCKGSVVRQDGATISLVVGMANSAGNIRAGLASLRTIDRFRPRHLLVSGIAGGLPKGSMKQGDLFLARTVWHYEYGKVSNKGFTPRHQYTFQCDQALLGAAVAFRDSNKRWKECRGAPESSHAPAGFDGTVASGEKVIEDFDQDFAKALLEAEPELQAVEMESAGAAAAVEQARSEGRAVGFGVVRGISDMPKINGQSAGAGTEQRDQWKAYAAALAAQFIHDWVCSGNWPTR